MKKNLLVVLIAAFAASSSFAGALDGGTVNATNDVAIGPGAFTTPTANNSVVLGAGSTTSQANVVEVGGRRITGAGAGVNSSDVATLGQVETLLDAALGLSGPTQPGITQAKLNGVHDELAKGIAAVAATPSLPALAAGERAVAAGMASYNGFQAVGVTFAQAVSNQAQFYVGANFSGDSGGTVFRGGGAWKF